MSYKQPNRPQYHFSAPKGWLNDPNGTVYFNGEYHLFYQYNPNSISWDTMHWGHAVSKDMVHWENLPIALFPDENGTCFSGSCVVDEKDVSGLFDGKPGLMAFYTGHIDRPFRHCLEHQCVAYSKDNGRTWEKYEGNPVITPPGTPDDYDFRDPKVFWHEESGKWVMILGGGFYRVYNSDDLLHWELVSTSHIFEEFPDLFRMKVEGTGETKWILNLAGFKYYVGSFDGKEFIREEGPYICDRCDGCQATYTYYNMPDGRTCYISWQRDGQRGPTDPWRNNMTVSREVRLVKKEDGTHELRHAPVREVDELREELLSVRDVCVRAGDDLLTEVRGQEMDITFTLSPAEDAHNVCLSILKDKDQQTDLFFDFDNGLVFLDYTAGNTPSLRHMQVSLDQNYFMCPELVKLRGKVYEAPIRDRKEIKCRVLVDRICAEIFLDDGATVFTFNVYPDACADGFSLTSDRDMEVKELNVYKMKGIWER